MRAEVKAVFGDGGKKTALSKYNHYPVTNFKKISKSTCQMNADSIK